MRAYTSRAMNKEEGKADPMIRLHHFRFLAGALLLASALSWGQSDFNPFFSEFQAAVARKDQAALSKMMSSHFDYFQARGVSHVTVFQQLDAEGGKQWANLQNAAKGGPIEQTYDGKPARELQCTPTNTAYRCLIVFQQNSQGRWRWKGMIMPRKR